MNCEDLRRSLVFYLDGEIDPAGRQLMEEHLAECEACQSELHALAATRRSAARALNELTGSAQPSQQAWSRLQARLAEETHLSPAIPPRWFARPAWVGDHNHSNIKTGDGPMWKRFLLPAMAVVMVMLALAVYMLQNVTPVSAQQILQRAAEAQASAQSARGIRHLRVEVYMNVGAEPGEQAGMRTIEDSYLDLGSGKLRRITLDPKSGQVLDAFAYDGAFTYSTNQPLAVGSSGPLTIYRSPQSHALVAVEAQNSPSTGAEKLFNEARDNPNVELSGKQKWAGGRTVYVVRTQGPVKAYVDHQTQTLTGATTLVFDAQTYHLLESQTAVRKAGQEILTSSYDYRVDEILPAGSPVAWDLSDLQGVRMVVDASGDQGSLLPEVISPQDLAAHAPHSYLLKNVPQGFVRRISASPQQKQGEPFAYVASYRDANGNYFVVQSAPQAPGVRIEKTAERYTTAAGLVLEFYAPLQSPGGGQIVSATFKSPEGGGYLLTSNLPLAQVKELAEDLVQAK